MRFNHLSPLAAVVILAIVIGCSTPENKSEALAKKYCGSCHAFPEPSLLDKTTWQKKVLPQMSFRMGRNSELLWQVNPDEVAQISSLLPANPMVTDEEWEAISNYYKLNAPDTLLSITELATQQVHQFFPQEYSLPSSYPCVTHISFDPNSESYFVGTRQSMLYQLNAKFETIKSQNLSSPISHINTDRQPWVMSCMGIMDPNDQAKGELQTVDSNLLVTPIIPSLKRPAYVSSHDFNNDGKTDYLISEFGNYTGRLMLFEHTVDKFIPHPIHYLPGTRKTILTDYDKDGVVDILALITQGDEQIVLYRGHGGFNFTPETLLRFPPVYGSSYFELIDFNEDGLQDILYTNGDNADYSQILKPYHGVRIFINRGKNKFDEQVFLPMHGASMAIARDFDKDRDLDIAAISFFPDFQRSPEQGFIYFQNDKGTFIPQTIAAAENGRWLTMTAADIDHDNDHDLILGSLNFTPGVPENLANKWRASNTSLLVLKNKLK